MNSRSPSQPVPFGPNAQEPQRDEGKVMMNVLVVEDDPVIGKSLSKGLSEAGHSCVWVKNGQQGLDHILSQRFDVIVLDLLLPEIPGLEVLRAIRAAGVRTPILLLTAM